MKKINEGKFKAGTKFIGNVNKARMEVVKIKKPELMTASGRLREGSIQVVIKVLKSGKTFTHGLGILECCDVTIIE